MCDKQIWLESLPYYDDIVSTIGEYDDKRDYVGAEDDWKSKFIPRTVWGIDINMAAYVHDYFYTKGGGDHERFVADLLFQSDMMKLINLSDSWAITRFFARHRATTYYHFVCENGADSFSYRLE